MLANWNMLADTGAKADTADTKSGVWIASTSRTIPGMKIVAVETARTKINALALVASIHGDFHQFCSRSLRRADLMEAHKQNPSNRKAE